MTAGRCPSRPISEHRLRVPLSALEHRDEGARRRRVAPDRQHSAGPPVIPRLIHGPVERCVVAEAHQAQSRRVLASPLVVALEQRPERGHRRRRADASQGPGRSRRVRPATLRPAWRRAAPRSRSVDIRPPAPAPSSVEGDRSPALEQVLSPGRGSALAQGERRRPGDLRRCRDRACRARRACRRCGSDGTRRSWRCRWPPLRRRRGSVDRSPPPGCLQAPARRRARPAAPPRSQVRPVHLRTAKIGVPLIVQEGGLVQVFSIESGIERADRHGHGSVRRNSQRGDAM